MLFDLRKFHLISESENIKYYEYQESLIQKMCAENETDTVIRIALLVNLAPVADCYEALQILKEYFKVCRDIKIAIIGAEISEFCGFDCFFINYLEAHIEDFSDFDKSMIYYLMSRFTDRNLSNYVDCLEQSIKYAKESSTKFVQNYLNIARVLDNSLSKEYVAIAISNVVNADWDKSPESTLQDYTDYNQYISEFILVNRMSRENYRELLDFFEQLCD